MELRIQRLDRDQGTKFRTADTSLHNEGEADAPRCDYSCHLCSRDVRGLRGYDALGQFPDEAGRAGNAGQAPVILIDISPGLVSLLLETLA